MEKKEEKLVKSENENENENECETSNSVSVRVGVKKKISVAGTLAPALTLIFCSPYGNRTRVTRMKIWCPNP
jgi:hypothetical protein